MRSKLTPLAVSFTGMENSEFESRSKCQDAGRQRSVEYARRRGIVHVAVRIPLYGGVDAVVLRMVQDVVCLHLEFHAAPLAEHRDELGHGGVQIGDVRIAQHAGAAAQIARTGVLMALPGAGTANAPGLKNEPAGTLAMGSPSTTTRAVTSGVPV